jgi:predicted GIY-YIG superfamily endonuclease
MIRRRTAHEAKKVWQADLDAGRVRGAGEIRRWIAALDWIVTRDTPDYLGFEDRIGNRSGVRLPKQEPDLGSISPVAEFFPQPGPIGCFVYALFIEAASACYVGHTRNLYERMQRHRLVENPACGSAQLFQLATEHKQQVRIAMLEELMDRGSNRYAYEKREAVWFYRFQDAGWKMANLGIGGGFLRPVDLEHHRLHLGPVVADCTTLDEWLAVQIEAANAAAKTDCAD